jgi:hypothetical protein
MTPLQSAADALSALLRSTEVAQIDPFLQVSADEASGTIVVTTAFPKKVVKLVPFRYQSFPVKLVDGSTALAARPAAEVAVVAEVLLPARRAPATSTDLARVDEDARLWEAIAGRGDALSGMDFSTAARLAPLRVEALIHAHIHAAFSPMQGPGAEGPQRGTYLLRNQTLRQVHGTITPLMLADQLRRSGEDHATLFAAQRQQAAAMGGEAALLRAAAAVLPAIRRAFAEGRSVAMRAAEATDGEVRDGWAQVAIVVRAMGQAMDTILSPGPLPPALAGTRAIGAAPRRLPGE